MWSIRFESPPAAVTVGEGVSAAARYWRETLELWILPVVAVGIIGGAATWLLGSVALDQATISSDIRERGDIVAVLHAGAPADPRADGRDDRRRDPRVLGLRGDRDRRPARSPADRPLDRRRRVAHARGGDHPDRGRPRRVRPRHPPGRSARPDRVPRADRAGDLPVAAPDVLAVRDLRRRRDHPPACARPGRSPAAGSCGSRAGAWPSPGSACSSGSASASRRRCSGTTSRPSPLGSRRCRTRRSPRSR